MSRLLLLLSLSALLTFPAMARVRVSAGGSIGTQIYESSTDKIRLVGGLDGLLEFRALGIQAAHEFTNRSTGGSFGATHFNATWRFFRGSPYSVVAGAGLTKVRFEAGRYETDTWNAAVELDRHFSKADLYLRVRHYDYSFGEFRGDSISAASPAISAGVRFVFARP